MQRYMRVVTNELQVKKGRKLKCGDIFFELINLNIRRVFLVHIIDNQSNEVITE